MVEVMKAKAILGAAADESSKSIAQRIGMSDDFVSFWRGQYSRHGMDGLKARSRSGRPRVFTPLQRVQIIGVACEPGPAEGGLHGWTVDLLVQAVKQRGIADISRSQLNRILLKAELQPHRQKQWLHSPDPLFREKVAEIVELYLNPPTDVTVVSIDEKPGMQALERKHPDQPAKPGQLLRREFEYIRHGTLTMIASFTVRTGAVYAHVGPTRTAADLERFMDDLATRIPGIVHVIWDNLNIHKGERWERFNERHGHRFVFHFTPIHASWVNQIEIWFSIIQRRCLRNGSFASQQELQASVEAFIAYWNDTAKHPFKWTFAGFKDGK